MSVRQKYCQHCSFCLLFAAPKYQAKTTVVDAIGKFRSYIKNKLQY